MIRLSEKAKLVILFCLLVLLALILSVNEENKTYGLNWLLLTVIIPVVIYVNVYFVYKILGLKGLTAKLLIAILSFLSCSLLSVALGVFWYNTWSAWSGCVEILGVITSCSSYVTIGIILILIPVIIVVGILLVLLFINIHTAIHRSQSNKSKKIKPDRNKIIYTITSRNKLNRIFQNSALSVILVASVPLTIAGETFVIGLWGIGLSVLISMIIIFNKSIIGASKTRMLSVVCIGVWIWIVLSLAFPMTTFYGGGLEGFANLININLAIGMLNIVLTMYQLFRVNK